jgi:hypothetical protein
MRLHRTFGGTVVAALLLATTVGAVGSHAATQAKSYSSCKALNQAYPHGVGKSGARDKTASGEPVTNFKVSATLYAYNDGKQPLHTREHDLDRDNDNIACEHL